MNSTAILIQRILAFQAKVLLLMTFWTNIDQYHMFYIMIYVTFKLTEHGKCIYSAVN